MSGMRVLATGRALPEQKVTNDELASKVESSDEWISTRTGIRSRYFSKDEKHYELCAKAAAKAIERSEIDVSKLACCIVATITPDYATPSAACMVQKVLDLPEDMPSFDVNAACSGFLYGINIAQKFLTDERPYALVIGAEQLSRILNMEDRTTCVLFGDGAGAVIIEKSDKHCYYGKLCAKGEKEALFCDGLSGAEPYVHMNGKEIFRFAVAAIDELLKDLLEKTGFSMDDMDFVICHQANARIIAHVQKKWKEHEDKFVMNMERYGNTSAASIPILIDELAEEGRLKKGMKVACIGFGGGLTKASGLLEF